jgi:hypothetical protein
VDFQAASSPTSGHPTPRVAHQHRASHLGGERRCRPMARTAPSSSTRTGVIDAYARSCSNNESAIGTPAISAGPSSGTDEISNLAAVCPAHHRLLVPHGLLTLTGNPNLPDGLDLVTAPRARPMVPV